MTLAPKCDISIASAYVIRGMVNAFFTRRGSAVRTPLTSVHISIAAAPNPAANKEAV